MFSFDQLYSLEGFLGKHFVPGSLSNIFPKYIAGPRKDVLPKDKLPFLELKAKT